MAGDQHMWADLLRHAGFLGALDQVVGEHAHATAGAGPELGEALGEIVQALQVLDDDAFDAQVMAPHALDDGGVVDALHPNAAGQRDLRLHIGDAARARRRTVQARVRLLRGGAGQRDAAAVDEERAGRHAEKPHPAAPVLQLHAVGVLQLLEPDHRAHVPVDRGLHDEPLVGRHLRGDHGLSPGVAAGSAEDVLRGVRVVEAHGESG